MFKGTRTPVAIVFENLDAIVFENLDDGMTIDEEVEQFAVTREP